LGQLLHELDSPYERDWGRFGLSVDIGTLTGGSELRVIAIGAENETSGMEDERTGRAYIFDGATGTVYFSFLSPDGEQGGRFGSSIAFGGDVDNDGWQDVLVGAPEESPGKSPYGAGRVHAFSGQTGALVYSLISPNEQFMGFFGTTVSDVEDIDDDGYADILVGASHEDVKPNYSSAGNVYILSGQTGFPLESYTSPNTETGSLFGSSLGRIGDIDEDGYDDIVVGANGENPGTGPELMDAGRAYIISAKGGSIVHTLVSPNAGWMGRFGFAVSSAGDTDGDGYDDVVIGAPSESIAPGDYEDGRAYLFSGLTGALLHVLVPPNGEIGGLFGYSVSAAGDVDGDDCGDVIVGVPLGEPGFEPSNAGAAHVFSGRTGALLYTLSSPTLEYGGHFGHSVSGGVDVSDDGFPDVICGAPDESSESGEERAGHVYLFDGHLLDTRPENGLTAMSLVFLGPCPNPVMNVTEIRLVAPHCTRSRPVLRLFDLFGRQIGQTIRPRLDPGEQTTIRWSVETDGTPAGLYWWRLEAGGHVHSSPMIVLK
jgi:hypothetical protein